MDNPAIYILMIGVALVAIYLLSCIRILYEYERGVVFRLGRIPGGTGGVPKGPGLVFIIWPIDRMVTVETRTIAKVLFFIVLAAFLIVIVFGVMLGMLVF